MYSDLINFLLSVFHSFHDYSLAVMEVLSYTFVVGDVSVSVGGIMFGSLFTIFAFAQVGKWLVK